MNRVQPRTLSGFMELLPDQQLRFDRMVEILRETYSLFGFLPMDTPLMEASEVLLAKGGGETEKQIYRFTRGETDLSLRFDLTVPLAKYVAMHHGSLNFPFRRYQIGKVYRGERPQRGRFREFYQADIDIIGNESLSVHNDAEIPAIIYTALQKMGLNNFLIRVNNRKILTGFYETLQLTEKSQEIMRIVDKLEKIGHVQVGTLLEEQGVDVELVEEIIKFLGMSGTNQDVLDKLEEYRNVNATFDQGLDELKSMIQCLGAFGVDEKNFKVDLTIARGLDYYTGTVYETILTDHPEVGSICSGGRYDNLAGYYTSKQLPGVGISIGLTRLFYILESQDYLRTKITPLELLVLPMVDDLQLSANVASKFREAGISTQLYVEDKKFKQKMAYADKLEAMYCVILGEDEVKNNCVTLKHMNSGEQQVLPLEEAVAYVSEKLKKFGRFTPYRG